MHFATSALKISWKGLPMDRQMYVCMCVYHIYIYIYITIIPQNNQNICDKVTCIYFSQSGFADLNIISTSFPHPVPASTSYFQEISESTTPTIPPHQKTNIFSNRRKCTKIWYFKADTMNSMKLINICRDLFTSYSAPDGEEFQMVGYSLQLNISNNFYKTGIYFTISHQHSIPSPMVVQNRELKLQRELFLITPTMMVL